MAGNTLAEDLQSPPTKAAVTAQDLAHHRRSGVSPSGRLGYGLLDFDIIREWPDEIHTVLVERAS